MALTKLVNGIEVKMTKAEETALVNEQQSRQVDVLYNTINHIASEKILNIAPIYKQNNMLARSIELLSKDILTEQELLEKEIIEDIWNRIKAIRTYSNTLRNNLTVNTNINEGWPE